MTGIFGVFQGQLARVYVWLYTWDLACLSVCLSVRAQRNKFSSASHETQITDLSFKNLTHILLRLKYVFHEGFIIEISRPCQLKCISQHPCLGELSSEK